MPKITKTHKNYMKAIYEAVMTANRPSPVAPRLFTTCHEHKMTMGLPGRPLLTVKACRVLGLDTYDTTVFMIAQLTLERDYIARHGDAAQALVWQQAIDQWTIAKDKHAKDKQPPTP